MIPLHRRGEINGVQWEVIGVTHRNAVGHDQPYPWQEFVLYNPYHGYRWLIFSGNDCHWSFGMPVDAMPDIGHARMSKQHHAEIGGDRYRHFSHSFIETTYCEGEFPWQVRVGDRSEGDDFVLPPHGLSIEKANNASGASINVTRMRYMDANEVWHAFGMEGTPPTPAGVGWIQPNPAQARKKALRKHLMVFLPIWLFASLGYVATRTNHLVVQEIGIPVAPHAQEIEIGSPGEPTVVSFDLAGPDLHNNWLFAEVMLIAAQEEQAFGFGAEASLYKGVTDGERWSEGSVTTTEVRRSIPGGTYLLQVNPQTDPRRPAKQMNISLREDPVLWRYVWLSLLMVIAAPIINFIAGALFEGKRWQQSDYRIESEDE